MTHLGKYFFSGLMLCALNVQAENCIDIAPGTTTAAQIRAPGSGTIVLRLLTDSESKDTITTEVVLDQSPGFICTIRGTQVVSSSYDSLTGLYTQTHEIFVDWLPGTGSGGCTISVGFPNEEAAIAHLYKTIDGDPASSEETSWDRLRFL